MIFIHLKIMIFIHPGVSRPKCIFPNPRPVQQKRLRVTWNLRFDLELLLFSHQLPITLWFFRQFSFHLHILYIGPSYYFINPSSAEEKDILIV